MDLLGPIKACHNCCSSDCADVESASEGDGRCGMAAPHRAQKFASSAFCCSQEEQGLMGRGYTIPLNDAQDWSKKAMLTIHRSQESMEISIRLHTSCSVVLGNSRWTSLSMVNPCTTMENTTTIYVKAKMTCRSGPIGSDSANAMDIPPRRPLHVKS